MTTFLFPGQGSQHKGMGAELFDYYPTLIEQANDILGYDIRQLCLHDPHKKINKTKYTQPALYTINALSYYKSVEFDGLSPKFALGHSLGEYNALLAAGVFDFETGLKLVKKRSELMALADGGSMAAVIGIDQAHVEHIVSSLNLDIEIANYNSPEQFVISGSPLGIQTAKATFEEAGANYITLNVSGAFHSVFMRSAQEEFSRFIEQFTFSSPKFPVIANLTAKPYLRSQVAHNLTLQISNPVMWIPSITYVLQNGSSDFKEIGPKKVLTGLTKKIQVDWDQRNTTQHNDFNTQFDGTRLGSQSFREEYNTSHAYIAGGMYKGIASKEMVAAMAKSGLMSFFGSGGLSISEIKENILYLQQELRKGEPYGMNLLCNLNNPKIEEDTIDLYLSHGINKIEAAAFMQITPALVKYKLAGLEKRSNGTILSNNKILAKISRPEIATIFLSPAPERIIKRLVAEGKITSTQAELAKHVPLADDICVEGDSGGHTDSGNLTTIFPTIVRLRDRIKSEYEYSTHVRIGAAGGIGTPEAALSAFILGADFILTGSINQCTTQAGTSSEAKELLQNINIQDTEYAPAGDMFELGAKVQVLKKGVFFPARANKLHELYRQHNSLDEIDIKTANQIQDRYFKRSFDDVYEETKAYYLKNRPQVIDQAESSPKKKMALIFRWYFVHSTRLAMKGLTDQKVDFQIHCGPALGAFNQWVKGTHLEEWKNRSVDEIALKLMAATDKLLNSRLAALSNTPHAPKSSGPRELASKKTHAA